MDKRDVVSWNSMISSYAVHGLALGDGVGRSPRIVHDSLQRGACREGEQDAVELEPTNAGNYALLAEIYAEAKMWDEVKRVKKVLEEKGLQKVPGCCWIEAKKRVYSIRCVDEVNPQIELVHALVVKVSEEMEQGYVPETKSVLYELDTEEKRRVLLGHSEK
ncbi:hypothetical protein SASPL_106405 [Salvia splendens]|uniref:DYW domain-containing protein n=1 Tax=Salvia splendens TaxID=180675 RepID=A0A8X8YSF1_SALSN|nr:hypothetical protein SASPL_106405 [Salvia splendens]